MSLRRVWRWVQVCALASVAGCIHVKIEETRQVAAAIGSGAGDGVVLVARPQQQGVSSESEFLDCLERQMGGSRVPEADVAIAAEPVGLAVAGGQFRLVPHQAFVDSVYPWLEPSTVLIDRDFATTLLARPGVRERISNAGVRYIVAIDGGTSVVQKSGSISCAIGPGGGGCLGVAFWKKQSEYEASIWDLVRGVSLGTVGADVSGNSVFIGALVPLPFVAPVQHTACKRMARELQRFLNGGSR
jgi:hypothetical protein